MSEDSQTEEQLVEHTYNGKTLKVYPEVAEFFTKKADAERLFNLEKAKVDQAYNALRDAAYVVHLEGGGSPRTFNDTAVNQANQDRRQGHRDAENRHYDLIDPGRISPNARYQASNPNLWADLLDKARAAGHKEVVWVLEHTLRQQPSETEIMLHYLPSTPEELWSYAKGDHDFCTVFDTFMGQAEAAGIFGDMEKFPGFKEFQAFQSYIRRNWGAGYMREPSKYVLKIMQAAREDYDKRLAEAKAEWQRQDEAYRSHGARKANAEQDALAAKAEVVEDEPAEGEGVSTPAQVEGFTEGGNIIPTMRDHLRTVLSST